MLAMQAMRVFAVSDLHITGPDDELYRSFVGFLGRLVSGDVLIIGGDLFDLLVGGKAVYADLYSEFFAAVKAAGERGARIHYIEGNHDFLVGRLFHGMPSVTVHSDSVLVETGEKCFFMAHGDAVDRKDYGYRVLRGIFRSPVMRFGVWLAPGSWVMRFGEFLSERSRAKRQGELSGAIPIDSGRVRLKFRNYAAERIAEGADFVILGHSHEADEMTFQVGDRKGWYFNVGYPRASRAVISWRTGDTEPKRERVL